MRQLDVPPPLPRRPMLRFRGKAAIVKSSPGSRPGETSRLIAKLALLEARLRTLEDERDLLKVLLNEADAALAEAGVRYRQGNIRERISAYQVFSKVMIFPL